MEEGTFNNTSNDTVYYDINSNITDIDNKKKILLSKFNSLNTEKKQKYGKIDISEPMSKDEKELNSKMSKIASEINSLVVEKRKILKSNT